MKREKKDQLGHILSLLGFLLVIFTGLANSLINLSDTISTFLVVLGITMLIAGVELVVKNRPEDSSE